jgi:hypothetical protein
MCNPFFHEFRVIPQAIGFQLVCYTLYCYFMHHRRSRLETDLDRRLAHLAGGEGQGAMIYLINDGSLEEQELTDETVTSAAAVHNNCHNTGPYFTCVYIKEIVFKLSIILFEKVAMTNNKFLITRLKSVHLKRK